MAPARALPSREPMTGPAVASSSSTDPVEGVPAGFAALLAAATEVVVPRATDAPTGGGSSKQAARGSEGTIGSEARARGRARPTVSSDVHAGATGSSPPATAHAGASATSTAPARAAIEQAVLGASASVPRPAPSSERPGRTQATAPVPRAVVPPTAGSHETTSLPEVALATEGRATDLARPRARTTQTNPPAAVKPQVDAPSREPHPERSAPGVVGAPGTSFGAAAVVVAGSAAPTPTASTSTSASAVGVSEPSRSGSPVRDVGQSAIARSVVDARAGSAPAVGASVADRTPPAQPSTATETPVGTMSSALVGVTSVQLGSFVVDEGAIGPPVEPSAVAAMVDGLARAGGARRVVVVLSPPELGRLRIVVTEAPGGTAVQLQVERPATQALIEQALASHADASGSGGRGGQPHPEGQLSPSRAEPSAPATVGSVRARRGMRVDTWI